MEEKKEIILDFSSCIDLSRLKELILYIAEKSKEDPRFGALKLNKILYYSDFIGFREWGEPITGATYQNLSEGPAPKEFLAAVDELEEEGASSYCIQKYFNYPQKRLTPQRPAKTSLFQRKQLELVDAVIEALWEFNGTGARDLTHNEWGWRLTEEGEEIPYRTTWLSSEPLTQEQISNGLTLWKEIND
jgi:hypothetical protein